ncbi:LOW QUALITY PROTEIN: beta-1,3-galactosyl-O-glycosyl-glycoprotein beta-1,6-N-acetylglucosaminyltransferase-like [Pecten maximus]|uniref:LOW QUALITY PROTEIN: beta-1,3-galactosyl-O-glycosyl-glycoprotein beta-1,6-N-acetylglucosaminyltransferase-like n=1 Tax=Pecten maximus TaxID=6579 RepID=UPI001457F512|nr:LOW QUALITY PROTEIN: beta-1,3-galactosyl-O-glycosyl-glycoprotein beta-1,6-N-acetylglucosaminyltransferase-like [Pecten maximus]
MGNMLFYRKRNRHIIILVVLLSSIYVIFRYQISSTSKLMEHYIRDHLELPKTIISNSTTGHAFPYTRLPVEIDCRALFDGKESELLIADAQYNLITNQYISNHVYIKETVDCATFRKSRGYITSPLSEEEELFSIAYSLVVYEDANQVERLLRALYQPQNYYCIHLDIKSPPDFRRAISGIAKCFDNVLISSMSVSVLRKSYTVLQPDLICMEDLWKYNDWKYIINIAGNEFPLRTNLELVNILKTLNGSNHVEGILNKANTDRWKEAVLPPHHIRPVKGSMHILATREFVDYVLHNQVAKDFLDWTKQTLYPEETFFSSLNYNPHLNVPGAFKGNLKEKDGSLRFFGRFVNWVDWINGTDQYKSEFYCHGKFIHGLCVFGVRDLPLIVSRPELFVNKFYRYFHPVVMDCMEELLFNRTRNDYLTKQTVNTDVYTKEYGWIANT